VYAAVNRQGHTLILRSDPHRVTPPRLRPCLAPSSPRTEALAVHPQADQGTRTPPETCSFRLAHSPKTRTGVGWAVPVLQTQRTGRSQRDRTLPMVVASAMVESER
jgi:hypothetical protein